MALVSCAAWAQATMPVTLDMPDEATFATWTVIDNNAEVSANTWTYGNAEAVYAEDKNNAADDWLIAPAIELEGGVTYTIDYYIIQKSSYYSDKQSYAITVGNAATIEAQTTVLATNESFTSKLYSKQTVAFTPAESGTYYLGVHLYSAKWQGDCGFQKFVVDKAKILPAQVSDLAVAAGDLGALTATLTWTMPATNQYGSDLTSLTGAKVMRGTEQIATVEGAVGQEMTYTDEALTEAGTYKYSIVAYNADGDAEGTAKQVTSPWIGNDTPNRVTNLAATADGQTVSLTWTAPGDKGTNDGYVNTEALTYRIVRGGEVLEENWSGEQPYTDEVGQLAKYSYTVYAIFDGKQSGYAQTSVVAGGAFDIPYSEEFSSQDNFDFFTSLAAAEGANTWTYSSYSGRPQFYDSSHEANAWLITPDINMQADKTYKMTFQTWLSSTYNDTYYKDMNVTIGQGKTIDAQTKNLWSENIQSSIQSTKEVYFSVAEDGVYNVGFNVQGPASFGSIYLDNIKIEESQVIPEAATDLIVTADEQGALKAEITWMNPAKDLAGNDLESLTKVELKRGDEVVYTVEAAEPGGSMAYTDETVPEAGYYKYSVVAYVEDRPSDKVESERVWIGTDVPAAVTDATLANVDDKPVVTWTAPTAGANGGYINAESITYRIVRNPDGEEVAAGLTETTFTDNDELSLANYSYTIYAVIGEQESEGTTTNAVIFGGALDLPYVADMADANHMALWTVVDANADGKKWTYTGTELKLDNFSGSNDDYVFTPPFNAPKGLLKLTYKVKGYSYRYSDSYEVVLTNTTAVVSPAEGAPRRAEGDVYSEVIETVEQNVLGSSLYTERSVEFNTPSAGVYHIGFRDTSADPWSLYIGATQVEVLETVTGIADIQMLNVKSVRYYNVAGLQSDVPFNGVNIVVMEMNDGTTNTIKVVK